jgi:hypothetical protein
MLHNPALVNLLQKEEKVVYLHYLFRKIRSWGIQELGSC